MSELVVFLSVEWFERLAADMRANEKAFRELGPIDCVLVAKIDRDHAASELFEITFAAYGVHSIRELVRERDASPSHFVLEADFRMWREMIENIHANNGPDLEPPLTLQNRGVSSSCSYSSAKQIDQHFDAISLTSGDIAWWNPPARTGVL